MPPPHTHCPLTRHTLADHTQQTLRPARRAKPAIVLARCGDHAVLVKDFAPTAWLYRALYGRWLVARECAIYRVLDGMEGVPAFRGRLDAFAFAVDYIDGRDLKHLPRGGIQPEVFDRLADLLRALHTRGVVHLDAHQQRNVLLDADARPHLVDFATAIHLGTGWLARKLLVPWLARADWRGFLKLKARYCKHAFTPDERRRWRRIRLLGWLWPPTAWRQLRRKHKKRRARRQAQRDSRSSDGS